MADDIAQASSTSTATIDPVTEEAALYAASVRGSDVVFECVGRTGMIGQCMDLAGIDGRVVVVGVCISTDTITPYAGLAKELDVRYALYYATEDFTETIDALAGHALELGGYLGDAIDLADLPARFAELVAGADGGKVVVEV